VLNGLSLILYEKDDEKTTAEFIAFDLKMSSNKPFIAIKISRVPIQSATHLA